MTHFHFRPDGSTFTDVTFDANALGNRDAYGNVIVTNPGVATQVVTLANPSSENPLTISEVAGERWGDYVTFKVTSADFTALQSMDAKLSWNTNEFTYVTGSLDTSNSFIPSDLPTGTTATDLDANGFTGSGVISLSNTSMVRFR